MIPILISLLIITALGTALYLYLRKEQDKLFPKDKYYEAAQSPNINVGKSKKRRPQNAFFEYLWLTGMSAISGLFIASIALITFLVFPNPELAGFIIWTFAVIVQYILIAPAAFAVITLVSLTHSKTHPVLRAGIPLIFNFIGANIVFIIIFFTNLQRDISRSYLRSNIHVSIENESVSDVPWLVPNPDVAYQATLHIKSDLRKEFPDMAFFLSPKEIPDMSFVLSPYDHYNKDVYDWAIAGKSLTAEELAFRGFNHIDDGEFDIVITIPIYEKDLRCDGKSLYLLYAVDHEYYKVITLTSNSINRQLQRIACNSIP